MTFHHLKVNRMTDPVGIAPQRLTFSFLWEGEDGDVTVTLERAGTVVCSALVSTRQSHCFFLPFEPEAGTEYTWYVARGRDRSAPARFETAYPFDAPWITPEQAVNHPALVRRFAAGTGPARLLITGLGLYEAYLNGTRVGDCYLTPGFSEYPHYLRFQTYDVTELLRQENELRVVLGDGWYKGRIGLQGRTNVYGDRYLLSAALIQNGRTILETGPEFETWSTGFRSSGIYDGEFFDATVVPQKLCGTRLTEAPFPVVPQVGPPVKVMDRRKPVLICTPKGEQVLDFGQNMAGIVAFTCRAPRGTHITLQAGEILQQGCFYRDNLRDAKARFDYLSDGITRQVYQHFTYYGFRYLLVEGLEAVDPADFTALVLHSQLESTLTCETSHPGLNHLISNTMWGQKSNFVDLATDCPQRSERLGWTGDTQVFAPTACYQMDCLAFYEKTLRDLRAEQPDFDGNVPNYVPSLRGETSGGCAVWSDICTILPWTLYCWYGDRQLLAESYPLMRDYVGFLLRRDQAHGNTRLYHEGGFGDWLAGDGVCDQSFEGGTDVGFISAVYFRNSALLTARAARELGYQEDARRFEALGEEIRTAILQEYFTPSGRFALDTQTSYVLALHYGIYRDRQRVIDAFKARLERDFFKIKSGFTGTPLMLPTLFESGMDDYAYRMLCNEELPGWLYAVNMGATTIWERWNSVLPDGSISGTGMNSLNHYAYGSVCQAIYGDIAGLKPAAPGWKEASFVPHPNYRLGRIQLSYRSPAGEYRAGWQIQPDGLLEAWLTVPAGATARVELPDGTRDTRGPGDHHWLVRSREDYLHPFSKTSFLYDVLGCPEAARALEQSAPGLYAAASGDNKEFLTMTVEAMARIPMGPPVDLEAVDRALGAVSLPKGQEAFRG